MQRTLVTGAAGFIGSAVVRKLLAKGRSLRCLVEAGVEPCALRDLPVERIEGDIRSADDMRRALKDVQVVYHLAAIYRLWLPDSRRMYEVNVEGSRTLLAACLTAGVEKVVFTSSIATVGLRPEGQLSDESTPFNMWEQSDHYIRSKWLSEQVALEFAAKGLPLVVVNPAFPFGYGDRAPTPTGRFVGEAMKGLLPGYPPGGFNVVDVDDVAEGHLLAEARARIGERYILGNHNLSYRSFYNAVTDIAGLAPIRWPLPTPLILGAALALEHFADFTKIPPKITYKAARYAMQEHYFDTRKARDELGMPQTPLYETIAKSVRWFRNHPL